MERKITPKDIIVAMRLPFVSASALPALIAVAWAWGFSGSGRFDPLNAFLAVLGVVLLHLGTNTLNDYYDWDQSDRVNRFPSPFSGGTRSAVEGILDRRHFLLFSVVLYAAALLIGLYMILNGRPYVLLFGFIGFLGGVLYSAAPAGLMNRGLGELDIFFMFGPLITLGTGYAIEGAVSLDYFLIGIPMGLIVANILWINQFPDFEADATVGKRNLVVRLGTGPSRYVYLLIMAAFYVSIILLWWTGVYPAWSLIALVTLPLVIKSVRHAWRHHGDPKAILPSQAGTIQVQTLSGVILAVAMLLPRLF
jgi:1,4-dihydroxy-2-naphthoate octaprenyltransferase